MQSEYVSLDPTKQEVQSKIYQRRIQSELLEEARGGVAAQSLQTTFGITAGLYMYVRAQRSGFTVLPLARHKAYTYAQIAAAAWIAGYIAKDMFLSLAGNPHLERGLTRHWYYEINSNGTPINKEQ